MEEGNFFGGAEGGPELPVEVVLEVLAWLRIEDLVRVEAVCRRWRGFLSAASPLGSTLWRIAHEAEFGGPMPLPVASGGSKQTRKLRLHQCKRGDWRLFSRTSLRTLYRIGGGSLLDRPARTDGDGSHHHYRMYHHIWAELDSVKALIRWTFACGHHAAFARLLRPPAPPATKRLIGDLVVQGWTVDDPRGPLGNGPVRVEPLAWAVKSRSVELLAVLVVDLQVALPTSPNLLVDLLAVTTSLAASGRHQDASTTITALVLSRLPVAPSIVFHLACERGEVEVARALLAQCESPEARAALLTSTDGHGQSGLALACGSNRTKMIEFLLREESWPRGKESWFTKALMRALPRCSVAVLAALLEGGARAGESRGESFGGYYPIHLACQRADGAEVVALLLAHGANVDCPRPKSPGSTPLHLACGAAVPSTELVQLLLDHGARPNPTDAKGCTPMLCLLRTPAKSAQVSARKVAVARVLAERGGSLGAHPESLRVLLDWVHDRRYPGTQGKWPERDRWVVALAECLFELGCLSLPTKPSVALMNAVIYSTPHIIAWFIGHGFPVHELIASQSSLLYGLVRHAAGRNWQRGQANLRALLSAGLDLRHALRFVEVGDLRTLDLLLAHGADINVLHPGYRGAFVDFPRYYPSPFATLEPWLRALHRRGLRLDGVGFGGGKTQPFWWPWRLTDEQEDRIEQVLAELNETQLEQNF